jgi:hypothetical protein
VSAAVPLADGAELRLGSVAAIARFRLRADTTETAASGH